MSEMVERGARAICIARRWSSENWDLAESEARAVIAAMREPTDAMLDYRDAFVKKSDALLVWQHQIDEALK